MVEDNGQGMPAAGGNGATAPVRIASPPAPGWSIWRNGWRPSAAVAKSTAQPAGARGWK